MVDPSAVNLAYLNHHLYAHIWKSIIEGGREGVFFTFLKGTDMHGSWKWDGSFDV